MAGGGVANSPPARRLGTLERRDCRIHYEVTGNGPALIFLHGLGGNQVSWWQQVAHFARTHTCVTFAARGFAPSSPLPAGPDPNDYAGDLAALISHLGLTNVVLVGQSMGGWGSLEYALTTKGNVRGLVLAATTGTLDFDRIDGPQKMRLAGWQADSRQSLQSWTALGIHPACGARMAREQPALHLLYKHIDDMNTSLDKVTLRERLGLARVRPPADIATVGCPVLFISGDEDVVIPPFAADALVRLSPQTRVVHVPDAGHSVYFERAERFNAIVEAFLGELPPA